MFVVHGFKGTNGEITSTVTKEEGWDQESKEDPWKEHFNNTDWNEGWTE